MEHSVEIIRFFTELILSQKPGPFVSLRVTRRRLQNDNPSNSRVATQSSLGRGGIINPSDHPSTPRREDKVWWSEWVKNTAVFLYEILSCCWKNTVFTLFTLWNAVGNLEWRQKPELIPPNHLE